MHCCKSKCSQQKEREIAVEIVHQRNSFRSVQALQDMCCSCIEGAASREEHNHTKESSSQAMHMQHNHQRPFGKLRPKPEVFRKEQHHLEAECSRLEKREPKLPKESAEACLANLFSDTQLAAAHAKRKTVCIKDMMLVRRIRREVMP